MTAFLALASASFAALDTTFGEPLTITPQMMEEFVATGPDPEKPAFTAMGILDFSTVIVVAAGEQTAGRSQLQATLPMAEFAFTAFGPGKPLPVAGWRLDATANPLRPPPTAFMIRSRLPDGDDGRVRFQLVALTS